jgi:hypothetical protein
MTVPRAAAIAAGLILTGVGLWAFFAARSFYDAVATYPPYNEHFLHDIGAFNLGLGAVLLLTLKWSDALLLALAGNAVGATFHAASHIADAEINGPRDPILTTLLAVTLIAAAAWRWRAIRT